MICCGTGVNNKNKWMKKILIVMGCIALFTSCATLFNGSKARIIVNDNRLSQPVDLTVDGAKYPNVMLPAKVKVRRGFKYSTILAESEGYEPSSVVVQKRFNGTTLWNLLLGGVPGFAVDAATGAMMKPVSQYYDLNMHRLENPSNYVEDPTITSGEAKNMVSRDAPGATDLERTVIRWFFDSDPRGARIYWRVISSIPSIVKNTNETYLMTTPFEETRSFNILGLTYENSRDVQIEIKVSKKGYEDQVKRFNVRQAIDQQEISGFFELISKE